MATNSTVELKMDEFDALAAKIKELVKASVHEGVAMHVLEQDLLTQLMRLGHAALSAIFRALGDGDVGPTLQHPEHKKPLIRFPQLSTRTYRSIFGDFEVTRYLYGRTISQKSFAIPLDEQLGLPENSFSLLLEAWVAQLSTSEPIHEAMEKLHRILGISIAVDSAERILDRVAKNAEHFQDNLPPVEVAAEGELLVETTDNKGIVMRHKSTADKLPVGAPSMRRGPVPDRKQMATVCGCYSIAPYVRTPEDVLEALFREPKLDELLEAIGRTRPRPIQSRYQACLSREQDHPDDWLDGEVSAISWLTEHVRERRQSGQVLLNLNDGERSIWNNVEILQDDQERVDILDVIHGIQRVWDAGAILNPDNLTGFAKMHIRSILEGKVKHVIQSFRWQATNRSLKSSQKEAMRKICGFLEHNADRMKYDEYLAKGYPIASGFIEGACRHLIKDRMERSGMRWTVHGAQNMLYLRCLHAGKLWSAFIPLHQLRTLSHYGTRTNYLEQFQLAA